MKTLKALWVYILAFFAIPKKEEPEQYSGVMMGQNRQPPPPFQTGPDFSDINWNRGANAAPGNQNPPRRTPPPSRLPLPFPTYYDELVLAGLYEGEVERLASPQFYLRIRRDLRRLEIIVLPATGSSPVIMIDALGATSLGCMDMPEVEILSMLSAVLEALRDRALHPSNQNTTHKETP